MYSKTCFKCLAIKPIAEFSKNKKSSDGHSGKCKACANADAALHRLNNLERLRDYDRKRYADPKRRACTLAADRKRYGKPERRASVVASRIKYPEKHAARSKVKKAVERGALVKPSACTRCGGDNRGKPLEGSHDDYSKPLDVEWLCRTCHVKKDRPRDYVL